MPNNFRKSATRSLRRTMTDAEHQLWRLLRDRRLSGAKFRRQHPVGPFTADFYCHEHRLVIEADGGQHLDSEHDANRTAFMRGQGLRVLRFWNNNDILNNREAVLEQIFSLIGMNEPSPAATRRPARISRCPERRVRECAQERPRPHPRYATPWRGRPPEGEAKAAAPDSAVNRLLPEGEAHTTEETGS